MGSEYESKIIPRMVWVRVWSNCDYSCCGIDHNVCWRLIRSMLELLVLMINGIASDNGIHWTVGEWGWVERWGRLFWWKRWGCGGFVVGKLDDEKEKYTTN